MTITSLTRTARQARHRPRTPPSTSSPARIAGARLRTSGTVAATTALFLVAGASAEELIVQAGETHVLRAGNHRYDIVRLGVGATVELTGTTRVIAEKLVTDGDASVRYRGSDTEHDPKYFDLVILDGREMQGTLSINGSGKSRSEAGRGVDRDGRGHNGTPGEPGEAGMDIDLTLFEIINPEAHVTLVSRGGRGGKGGDGGTGMAHTMGSTFLKIRRRGLGGDGAKGGNGGNAGRIRVFGVHQESASASALATLKKFVYEQIRTDVVPGNGGDGGAGGTGQGRSVEEVQNGRAGVAGSAGATSEPVKALLLSREWLQKGRPDEDAARCERRWREVLESGWRERPGTMPIIVLLSCDQRRLVGN